MERVGKTFASLGKLGFKIFEGAVEGAIDGALKCFGPEKLGFFIENNYYIIESAFYGLHRPPVEHYVNMSKEEIIKVETFRRRLAKMILPIFGMARSLGSKFPPELLYNRLTGEWLYNRIKKRFPELAEVIEEYGDRGRRWIDKQAKEIVDYISGALIWDPNQLKFITREEYLRLYKHVK